MIKVNRGIQNQHGGRNYSAYLLGYLALKWLNASFIIFLCTIRVTFCYLVDLINAAVEIIRLDRLSGRYGLQILSRNLAVVMSCLSFQGLLHRSLSSLQLVKHWPTGLWQVVCVEYRISGLMSLSYYAIPWLRLFFVTISRLLVTAFVWFWLAKTIRIIGRFWLITKEF